MQRRAFLALSKAPPELFRVITKIEGYFLRDAGAYSPKSSSNAALWEPIVNSVLPQFSNVTCIEGPFMTWNGCSQVVDLRSMTQLTTIGDEVLCNSVIDELLLPTSLRSIGTFFLAESSVKKVNFSHTGLETVGHGFLQSAKCDELVLPRSLNSLGEWFLMGSSIKRVDLSKTRLENIEDSFLCRTACTELLLPRCLKSVGAKFLMGCSMKLLDQSQPRLENDRFNAAGVGELLLPRSLKVCWFVHDTASNWYCFLICFNIGISVWATDPRKKSLSPGLPHAVGIQGNQQRGWPRCSAGLSLLCSALGSSVISLPYGGPC
jgi:hypothetical protein